MDWKYFCSLIIGLLIGHIFVSQCKKNQFTSGQKMAIECIFIWLSIIASFSYRTYEKMDNLYKLLYHEKDNK